MKKEFSLEEKLSAIGLVFQGESARSVSRRLHLGHHILYEWIESYKLLGIEGLKLKPKKKKRLSYEEKCKIVREYHERELTLHQLSVKYNISESAICTWAKLVERSGFEALASHKSRPSKTYERMVKRLPKEEYEKENERLRKENERYDELVSYIPNGSITSLLRGGMKNDGTFGLIDNLTISYDGNQLLKVTDAAEALNYNGALDFNDGADADCEYQYDSNGALRCDRNRGITGITYDYGHHPKKISCSVEKKHIYNDYTPDGRKLSSNHVAFTPNKNGGYHRLSTTDLYVDGLILRNGVPFMWQFDGGYVELNANGTPTSWNYYVTDHLGSTRKVVDSNNNIKETINYYPFGSEMKMETPAQMQQTENANHPFRFTGKELDKQNGLNMYDFGARLFDVAGVPMWTSVDPLAEKYYPFTPYSYCAGDPVNKFDPDGRMPTDREAAMISQHVYDGKTELEGGWKLNGKRQQLENGLTYGIYYKENEGSTEYVLAFGGSRECSDYMTDIKQAMGMPDSQYGMAKELGEKFNCLYDKYEKTIVGHSLGGGLSQVASMATGIDAITINPAAVHNNTINALGLSNAPTNQIKNIIVRGDIVTSVQDASNFANSRLNVEGQRKYIGPRKHKFSLLDQFTNHAIQTAINFLKR